MPHDPDKLAKGVGLIASGTASIRDAADLTGVPYSTIRRAYLRTLGPDAPNKDEARKAADERIMANAYAVAEGTLGRMADEVDQADHRSLVAFADASSRVLGRLRGWDKGVQTDDTANQFAQVVDKILSNGGASLNLTITPIDREPEREVVDVVADEPSTD
jgi:hypothetical protein